MIEEAKVFTKKEEEEKKETRIKNQKYVLLPILDALGLKRKSWEKFKFVPDQMVGLIISCIKQTEQTRNRLVRRNIQLVREKESQGQAVMDFINRAGESGGKS
ncbi:MAG: hypothetical protein V3V31_10880 [Methylococcales bacterium]